MKPEDRQNPEANLRRRRFLLTASLGSAGAVAAAVVAQSPLTSETPPAAPQAKGDGYQLSEHILHYYRSTRI
ncbi:MAG: formate dehydrogenase [Sulfuritalea sp.]|nr:formate dehydrogenase [Sulfuritalea sp.]